MKPTKCSIWASKKTLKKSTNIFRNKTKTMFKSCFFPPLTRAGWSKSKRSSSPPKDTLLICFKNQTIKLLWTCNIWPWPAITTTVSLPSATSFSATPENKETVPSSLRNPRKNATRSCWTRISTSNARSCTVIFLRSKEKSPSLLSSKESFNVSLPLMSRLEDSIFRTSIWWCNWTLRNLWRITSIEQAVLPEPADQAHVWPSIPISPLDSSTESVTRPISKCKKSAHLSRNKSLKRMYRNRFSSSRECLRISWCTFKKN